MPLTNPVDEPIVAIVVLPLLHMPPVVASLKVIVLPTQTPGAPKIAGGAAVTVNVMVAVHPEGSKYFIVVVPTEWLVTIPVTEPIVATDELTLLHVPPGVGSLNVVVVPTQIAVAPVMDGTGIIVTDLVAEQPVPSA